MERESGVGVAEGVGLGHCRQKAWTIQRAQKTHGVSSAEGAREASGPCRRFPWEISWPPGGRLAARQKREPGNLLARFPDAAPKPQVED